MNGTHIDIELARFGKNCTFWPKVGVAIEVQKEDWCLGGLAKKTHSLFEGLDLTILRPSALWKKYQPNSSELTQQSCAQFEGLALFVLAVNRDGPQAVGREKLKDLVGKKVILGRSNEEISPVSKGDTSRNGDSVDVRAVVCNHEQARVLFVDEIVTAMNFEPDVEPKRDF